MKTVSGIIIPEEKDKWPEAIAELFANMNNEQQAKFFDCLFWEVAAWDKNHAFQWRSMQEHLTPKAKEIIDAMKDHTDP